MVLFAVIISASQGPEDNIPEGDIATSQPEEISSTERLQINSQSTEDLKQPDKHEIAYSKSYISEVRKAANECYFPNKLREHKILDFMV